MKSGGLFPLVTSAGYPNAQRSEIAQALARCRSALVSVGLFSALINMLMLTGPLFMLQVYDRVLPSGSVPTLVGLAVLTVALYAFQTLLEGIRARVLVRIGASLDESLSSRAYTLVAQLPLLARVQGDGLQPVRDLDQIRNFLSSAGPTAFFDLPWIPLYLGICFLFHPLIGIAAVVGGVILFTVTLAAELLTRDPARRVSALGAKRNANLEATRRNAEVVHAMGMGGRLCDRFASTNSEYLDVNRRVSDIGGGLGTLSRGVRLLIQSVVLGLGAYLVIMQDASPGIIIASSILVSRALSPVELAVGNWKGFVAARQSWARLSKTLEMIPTNGELLELPQPRKTLSVASASIVAPAGGRTILQDITFDLKAGDALGVIGPSASGKSSLARMLVGVWRPVRGNVCLDGAALDQWSSEILGRYVGYLPQSVELFDGTVAENIARFERDPSPEQVLGAAMAAGVHDLILSLPDGYETEIGESGVMLSAGQRQRVALARALYGDPFLVVLDEPNSNLDEEGDQALAAAIMSIRNRGGVAIVIAHRPSAIAACDQVLILINGRLQRIGPKNEILRGLVRPAAE
ncbi:type I secretion system permease/ATPase [Methyloceanibacter caenitepidi]|uniref:Type I secretion system ATPase n=1 Tax=Methyloceanibacter caenitepidi TaxID=1384459 RepID=A0A0A8K180_9HYPH|nr:type I secretion system permease/ATPase [Methyloceanibacter caenitepidi]BAQ16723.1 type I secretion system ATPase [Methyloceanibacter caenitepidi]